MGFDLSMGCSFRRKLDSKGRADELEENTPGVIVADLSGGSPADWGTGKGPVFRGGTVGCGQGDAQGAMGQGGGEEDVDEFWGIEVKYFWADGVVCGVWGGARQEAELREFFSGDVETKEIWGFGGADFLEVLMARGGRSDANGPDVVDPCQIGEWGDFGVGLWGLECFLGVWIFFCGLRGDEESGGF